VVRARRPGRGRHHPASAADVRDALATFGEEVYYGLESVELVPAPPTGGRLVFGELVGPGHIRLYDQPLPPWRLPYALSEDERAELQKAGADLRQDGVVSWPADSLRRFMLGHVLPTSSAITCFSTSVGSAANEPHGSVSTKLAPK
jgi:hypothetical protein